MKKQQIVWCSLGLGLASLFAGCGAPGPQSQTSQARRVSCPVGVVCNDAALRKRAKRADRTFERRRRISRQPPVPQAETVQSVGAASKLEDSRDIAVDQVEETPTEKGVSDADKVAVMPVRDSGKAVSRQSQRDLTQRLWRLGSQAVRDSSLVSMDEKNMSQFTGRDKTLGECVSEDAVESGRNLNAKYIVTTEVIKVPSGLRLDMYGHLTTTGQSLNQVNEVVDSEKALVAALERVGGAVLERILAHHKGQSVTLVEDGSHGAEDADERRVRHEKERGEFGYVDVIQAGVRLTTQAIQTGYQVTENAASSLWNALFGSQEGSNTQSATPKKEASPELDPLAQKLFDLGRSRAGVKDDLSSALFFRQAYEVDNRHYRSVCWLAKTYRRLGQHDQALSRGAVCVRTASKEGDNEMAALGAYNQGRVFELRGDVGAASRSYRQAFRWRATAEYKAALRRVQNR